MDKSKRTALRILRDTLVNSPILLSNRYLHQPDLFEKQALYYLQSHPEYRLDMERMDFSAELQACYQLYRQLHDFAFQYRPAAECHIVSLIAFNAVLATTKQVYRDFDVDASTRVLTELSEHFIEHLQAEFPHSARNTRH